MDWYTAGTLASNMAAAVVFIFGWWYAETEIIRQYREWKQDK